MTVYTPAETARRSGFTLDTLRYYEKIGLLADIDRTRGGQRVFTDDDLDWLSVLRCLRDTGMPIAQMCVFAEMSRAGTETETDRLALLRDHALRVQEQMRLLDQQHEHLQGKIRYYERRVAGSARGETREVGL
ncbi:MerR family transcriptional regulator [Asanoa iriomotensis]|uniref:MerR family transcriptional regulator n=1 Tax=Asanoa iriomotensis TaxID=234613 RepID=A0ABQ4C458_9ACTN|nr:MerR family transcriptional regulator [Asanoa iriomotensis]GIF57557.1 MerR family transcriptional regulator [Asanoa iriomotensis]